MAAEQLAEAQAFAKEIEDKQVTVAIKVGEGGKVFGSVSAKEIAEAAKEQLGYDIDKKKMQLPGPIKVLGTTEVPIRLHTKVTAKLKVIVKRAVGHRFHADGARSHHGGIGNPDERRFYQHQYGVIFDAMVELFNEGKPVDLVTLQNRLREKDVPPEISSMEFVRDLFKCGADFGECAPLCEHRQRESGAAPSH